MLKSLTCPKCGAPLEVPQPAAGPTLICPFCNTPVELPAEARPDQPAPAVRPISLNWREWSPLVRILVIVVAASIILPACLGFAGTCLGVVAGVAGPLIAVVLPFLVKP